MIVVFVVESTLKLMKKNTELRKFFKTKTCPIKRGRLRWFSHICKDSGDFVKRFVRALLKSDTVAVLALLPWYPRYYCWNGYKFYGVTTVLGSKYAGIPWGWGPVPRYMDTSLLILLQYEEFGSG